MNITASDDEMLKNKKENILKLKADYTKGIKTISEMNNNLTKASLIPICENFAYLKGNLINTNECIIYLGDEYFLKSTNKRASLILENRIEKIDKILLDLNNGLKIANNEIENFKNKINIPDIDKTNENPNLKKLDDETFEIVENISDLEYANTVKIETHIQQCEDDIIREKLERLSRSRLEFENKKYTSHNHNSSIKKEDKSKLKKKDIIETHIKDENSEEINKKRSIFFNEDNDEDV